MKNEKLTMPCKITHNERLLLNVYWLTPKDESLSIQPLMTFQCKLINCQMGKITFKMPFKEQG